MVKVHSYLNYLLLCCLIGKYTVRSLNYSIEGNASNSLEASENVNGHTKKPAHSTKFDKRVEEIDETALIINEAIDPKDNLIASLNTSFIQLVSEGHLSIDKTLFIRYITRKSGEESVLILCPRKWGKTTNLRMLESYLKIQEDSRGNIIPLEETSNYKFFQQGILPDGNKFKNPPLIAKDEKTKEEYLGKWPVMFVDLNIHRPSNIEEFRNALVLAIRNTYSNFEHLREYWKIRKQGNYPLNEKLIASLRLADFNQYYLLPHGDWTDSTIQCALFHLTSILHQHYQKSVFVLVDEYDTPFNIALTSPDFREEDRESAFSLCLSLCLFLLRGNTHVHRSVVVGILKIAGQEMFSGWNSLSEYNFLNNKLFLYFGINQIELEAIYDYLHLPPDERLQVTRWYDGCRAGEEAHPLRIANPASIRSYFKHRKFRCYWEGETRTVGHLLMKLFRIKPFMLEMNHLMKGGSVVVDSGIGLVISFSQDDLRKIYAYLLKDAENIAWHQYQVTRLMMKLLFVAGYLTSADDQDHLQEDKLHRIVPQEIGTYVRIPNVEIYYAFGRVYGSFLRSFSITVPTHRYYQEVSKSFRSFVESDATTSPRLENQFSSFLSVLPHLVPKEDLNRSNNYEHNLISNELLINSIIVWIGVYNEEYFNFTVGQVPFQVQGKTCIPDGIFTVGSRGIICELKFGDEFSLLDEAMKQIKEKAYPAFFRQYNKRFEHIQDLKFIAIQVCLNTTTRISAEVIPSRLAKDTGYTKHITKASKPRRTTSI